MDLLKEVEEERSDSPPPGQIMTLMGTNTSGRGQFATRMGTISSGRGQVRTKMATVQSNKSSYEDYRHKKTDSK